jgi:NTE family protein
VNRRRIAIACQGGGSQCAFVAGALRTLFAKGVQYRFRIVGMSGTAGGAVTAAVAWTGLLKQARGDRTTIEDRIVDCWTDLSAQTPREIAFDHICVQSMRMVERGVLPSFAVSPSSPRFQLWAQLAALLMGRPEFTDLGALLAKHIDFGSLPSLVDAQSPILLVGAGDVLEGSAKVFSSARGEITLEALLASAAVPTLFPPVWADGHAYWDGIFAANPPVVPFLRQTFMGKEAVAEEIWVIQVSPAGYEAAPDTPGDIFARRSQMSGNLNLQHELELIHMVNLLLQEDALTDTFRARFGLESTESITVRFIRMSDELQEGLDYPGKLSRQRGHIDRLMADGEAQANAFLADLPDAESRWSSRSGEGSRPAETS